MKIAFRIVPWLFVLVLLIGWVVWKNNQSINQSINQSRTLTSTWKTNRSSLIACNKHSSIVDNLVRGYPKISSSPQQRFSTMRVSGKPLMDLWPGFADILSLFIANTDLWIRFCDTVLPNLFFSCCCSVILYVYASRKYKVQCTKSAYNLLFSQVWQDHICKLQ